MWRGILFTALYYVLSVLFVLLSLPCLLLPWRGPVTGLIRTYCRSINFCLRWICGIRKQIRGQKNLPDGPFILAPKHASWGDGFMIYPEFNDLAFVTGDHLERYPFVRGILKKLGAIVIRRCGGNVSKADSLALGLDREESAGRRILIYPEGHLAPAGYHYRYKPGVWHMQNALNLPIVPVATNLNCFWQQENIEKKKGVAIIEFLPPIPPGGTKQATLRQLTDCIETRCSELIAEARKQAPVPTRLLADP